MDLPINYKDAHWSLLKKAQEQYIQEQGGKCYHCKESLKNKSIHLHYCPKTHMTTGAVHAKCHSALWQYCGE